MRVVDDQRSKREAATQIRRFMTQFELGSELNVVGKINTAEQELRAAEARRGELERTRSAETHPTDPLRERLRRLSSEIAGIAQAVSESQESIGEQRALRAELITAKVKAQRADTAATILEGVEYQRCPQCGSDVSNRIRDEGVCRLCGSGASDIGKTTSSELEALRRDLNERIDQIAESIARRERELKRMMRQLEESEQQKGALDRQLQEELRRYDSAFVESIRAVEREIATLSERLRSLRRLQQLPVAINKLEEEAGALEGTIERLRRSILEERQLLKAGDANVAAIAAEFKRIMLAVGFPGVGEEDDVLIDPRNWRPTIVHGQQEWTFWDTGSGGKKTLFNVCYALAVHAVAMERRMPVPGVLIIDSPTKNISEDENPELVQALYAEIYRLAEGYGERRLQFLLIDSDLVSPADELMGFAERRMAGEPGAPCLIPYYSGP